MQPELEVDAEEPQEPVPVPDDDWAALLPPSPDAAAPVVAPPPQPPQPPPAGGDNAALCVVCLTNRANVLVLPCAHVCLCGDCRQEMGEARRGMLCPHCRGPLRRFQAIFFV
jgi:hypothetical protein